MTPEKTLFVRGATPVLLLAEAAVHDALPVVTAPDGAVPACDGWGIMARLTMCVVDGPGDAGVAIPSFDAAVVAEGRTTTGPDAMGAWCEDVDRAGGAIVLSLDRLPEVPDWADLLGSGTSRGGFLRSLG
ncbi:MAG TPA: hypothetical protein VLH10_01225 [Yinghuangia sp.]|uniref:hypothetical protein n=1 Tax=Yinghuangia sp. YIM S10712 TaxID=3436930 RepID=UPI002C18F1D9|nr:hypothetical protein [Yinghuangia sp.]